MIFFIVYHFALPALVGYAPGLMSRRILGVVNLAYLCALSQFFMARIIAALYARAAGRFDEMARKIIYKLKDGNRLRQDEDIPPPFSKRRISGKLNLRMPERLRRQLALEAARWGISPNRLINLKLTAN